MFEGPSSSTARRPCPRRSAEPSAVPRRSSAVRSTRRATSWSDCPSRCMPRFAACCDKHGSWTTPHKAERLLRNLAQRLERDWSGVAGSILEGIDEILTVTRLGLPKELRRSLACTNIIENAMSTVRRVCRNVKRWRSASMAMRWTAAAMQEAARGFRRLKAHKQLPTLRAALEAHHNKDLHGVLARQAIAVCCGPVLRHLAGPIQAANFRSAIAFCSSRHWSARTGRRAKFRYSVWRT